MQMVHSTPLNSSAQEKSFCGDMNELGAHRASFILIRYIFDHPRSRILPPLDKRTNLSQQQ
jgi:hypothetical protein